MIKFHKGQSLSEYAIVATIIAVALVVMGPGFRWGIQNVLKSTADAIGFQSGSEQASNPDDGFLNSQISNLQTIKTDSLVEKGGKYQLGISEATRSQSISHTNGAFVRD